MSLAENQRVVAAVRVRPPLHEGSSMQIQENFELPAIYCIGNSSLKVELTRPGDLVKNKTFTFDYVFDQDSTQLDVYENAGVELVEGALVGINATFLAYGQTGSGKTFTVLGDVKANPLEDDLLTTNSGLFLRVLSDLISYKRLRAQKGWHMMIGLSCIEIYCESIRDLFGGKVNEEAPEIKAKMINEEVLLPNLIVKEVVSLEAIFSEIQLAIARRQTRVTDSNSTSSRSHCLFMIDIMQQADSAPMPREILMKSTSSNFDDFISRRSNTASPTFPKSKRNGREDSAESLPEWEMPFRGAVLRLPGQKEPVYCSKIVLADLAGSERIVKSKVIGQGQKEAMSINASLTALGNVVHCLYEGSYVTYRDSNLTRLLKPTFSQPNSRVLLLAQCSPTQLTYDETISTLRFANKIKAIEVTSTEHEVDNLRFDYIEVAKTHTVICSELHIFAVEHNAHPAFIRRRLPQNKGLFYKTSASFSPSTRVKITTKERRAAVEAKGMLVLAQEERAAILKEEEHQRKEEESKAQHTMKEECDSIVKEHEIKMAAMKMRLQEFENLLHNHATQQLMLDASATRYQITLKEEEKWASVLVSFLQDHRVVCEKELSRKMSLFESITRDLAKMGSVTMEVDPPEKKKNDDYYSHSAWSHCLAKRFYSRFLELREVQTNQLNLVKGNLALKAWLHKRNEVSKKM